MRLLIRKTHRYLSVFIALQLLLWTLSGIYFAFNKIEYVRGEQYRKLQAHGIDFDMIDANILGAEKVRVVSRLGEIVLVISKPTGQKYLNAQGHTIDKITPDEALRIVAELTILKPLQVSEIMESPPAAEYRGRNLPLYRVTSQNKEDDKINVYVDAFSGELVAIRSLKWRIWDLMWGLHIMDWQARDDINNWLLKVFSILALVSSITGLLLFFKPSARSK